MKTKFLKFVRENWAKSEYDHVEWNAEEKIGTVTFMDGLDVSFEYSDGQFNEIER